MNRPSHLAMLGSALLLLGAAEGCGVTASAPHIDPVQTDQPRQVCLPLAEPKIGTFGLLTIRADPTAPMQVIDFGRLYDGRHKGDVIVWLQNVSQKTVHYATYELRAPAPCAAPAEDQVALVGAGHPQAYLISPDLSFFGPPAAPGERMVMVIDARSFERVEREIREHGCNADDIRPELVFHGVEFGPSTAESIGPSEGRSPN